LKLFIKRLELLNYFCIIIVYLLYNNCIMDFTTTTKLARGAKKEFESGCRVVLHNNEDIGMIFGKDFYDAIKDSGIIEQIREELWEANDPTTVELVTWHREWKEFDSISLEDFMKKHDL